MARPAARRQCRSAQGGAPRETLRRNIPLKTVRRDRSRQNADAHAPPIVFQGVDATGRDGAIGHVSPEERRKRLLERLDDRDKNWKLGLADVDERKRMRDYWRAHEAAFAATDGPHARWHIAPADDRHDSRRVVGQVVVEALDGVDLSAPPQDAAKKRELEEIRAALKN